jgi:hypothetical protein
MKLDPTPDGFAIDSNDLGPLLGLPPADVPGLMRQGQITCLSEKGQDADAGRFRVTFRYGAVRVRFTVDEAGNILFQSRISTS